MEEIIDVVYEPNWYCAVDNTPCDGSCQKVNGKTCKEKINEKMALGVRAYNKKHGVKKVRERY